MVCVCVGWGGAGSIFHVASEAPPPIPTPLGVQALWGLSGA